MTSLIIHVMQTLLDLEQHTTDAVIDLRCDPLRSHVHAGCTHFKHML